LAEPAAIARIADDDLPLRQANSVGAAGASAHCHFDQKLCSLGPKPRHPGLVPGVHGAARAEHEAQILPSPPGGPRHKAGV